MYIQKVQKKGRALLFDLIALFSMTNLKLKPLTLLFCISPYNIWFRIRAACLALLLLEDVKRRVADLQISFIYFPLGLYGHFCRCHFFVSDSCSTNRYISSKLRFLLKSCASHQYQLAVEQPRIEYEEAMKAIHRLIKQLRTPLIRSNLQKQTTFQAKLSHEINCTFTFILWNSVQNCKYMLWRLWMKHWIILVLALWLNDAWVFYGKRLYSVAVV